MTRPCRCEPLSTGILYAIDAKFSILIKIMAVGGPLSSGGPDMVLEADVVDGPVRGDETRLLDLLDLLDLSID